MKNYRYIDLDSVRQVPILKLASDLGIEVGKNNKAMCFSEHDKNTPSLSFTPGKNLWYCFGCGKKGGNIELVKEVLNLRDWKEAANWIESNYLSNKMQLCHSKILRKPVRHKIVSSHSNNALIPDSEVYERILSNAPISNRGVNYLKDRGFLKKTIDYFKIGEITCYQSILRELLSCFGEDRLSRCGIIKRDRGKLKFAWYNGFLLIPFYDMNGIAYIQGRTLSDNSLSPKYLNPFGVKKPLFNFSVLKGLAYGETIALVEGVMDAMAGHQLGWNTIGVLGATSFTAEYVNSLSRFKVVVIPDNDQAGVKFKDKIQEEFRKIGSSITVFWIDGAKDLSELMQQNIARSK